MPAIALGSVGTVPATLNDSRAPPMLPNHCPTAEGCRRRRKRDTDGQTASDPHLARRVTKYAWAVNAFILQLANTGHSWPDALHLKTKKNTGAYEQPGSAVRQQCTPVTCQPGSVVPLKPGSVVSQRRVAMHGSAAPSAPPPERRVPQQASGPGSATSSPSAPIS
eukprot:CAMPEP_0203929912 /NCGR_PEP_ID=MMETSP0359-20131031/68753_1 /ASSEMBLY_ACC=CAM_ASM_000338 /TAXON_ID=268821 /ORGANISM="Scrippsiella Hangoei, Strain SHTV-5" /LENGTH=164 /DNA_ID=CAMNT_0050859021 /DNA_START=28 /DNA_END=523 /DNA_ORIENTATION=+